MIKEKIIDSIKSALKNLGIEAENVILEHPADVNFGDYSTNVAMAYAKALGSNPRELAEKIKNEIEKEKLTEIEKIEVAGAGFINFYLSHEFFVDSTKEILKQKDNWGKNDIMAGKKVMVEYTDPNPFKPFHIGHLMTNAIGESVARIMEYSGAKTIRANYQGDVGPHVAKAIWGILNSAESYEGKDAIWIGEQYANGSAKAEEDEKIKNEIDVINKNVYDRSNEVINKIYDWGRAVTLEAFEEIYKILGTKFNHYFFESVMAPIGVKIVKENIPNVFEESDDI